MSTPGKRKVCLTVVGIEPVTFDLLANNVLRTELRGQDGSGARYFGTNLVPSISVCFYDLEFVFLMYSGEDICL